MIKCFDLDIQLPLRNRSDSGGRVYVILRHVDVFSIIITMIIIPALFNVDNLLVKN